MLFYHRSGFTSFLEGALLGDFSDSTTWSALAGQVAIGFVPYAGQVDDLRDLVAAGKAVAEGKENAGWQLALSAVAVVPGIGDAVKAIGKTTLGGAAILGTAALKDGDELTELGEGAWPTRRTPTPSPCWWARAWTATTPERWPSG